MTKPNEPEGSEASDAPSASEATDDKPTKVARKKKKKRAGSIKKDRLILVGAILLSGAILSASFIIRRRLGGPVTKQSERGDDPMPYVNYSPVRSDQRGKSGVTIDKKEAVSPGYNLFIQKPDSAALLVDNQGEVVHRWASEVGGDPHPLDRWEGWRLGRMAANGDLYVNIDHRALIKVDWNSKPLWTLDIAAHHDLILGGDGNVYAIYGELRMVDIGGKNRLIEDDGIAVVDEATGQLKKKISFYDVCARNPEIMQLLINLAEMTFGPIERMGLDKVMRRPNKKYSTAQLEALLKTGKMEGKSSYEMLGALRAIPRVPPDVFHANAVVKLDDHPKKLWKKGDFLVSLRYLNLVMVFDPETLKVAWFYGPGELAGQHEPSVLENGDVMIFDNGTWRTTGTHAKQHRGSDTERYTRVIEVDPADKKIVWSWTAKPEKTAFYSGGEGGEQVLPNGDLLLCEAERGRVIEIQKTTGDTVWEYFNPKFDKTGRFRSGVYRMERLPPALVEPLLKKK